jgi:hypothetical protein
VSDESVNGVDGNGSSRRDFSRRAALKAGVAAGVGVAAWSGASITSLGGTPAYAVGCTGAIAPIDISAGGGCRNVDNRSDCDWAYHDALKSGDIPVAGYPAGSFTATPDLGEGICCDLDRQQVFSFPDDLDCVVKVLFYDSNPQCTGDTAGTNADVVSVFPANGVPTNSDITVTFSCVTGPEQAWKFRIFANCATHGVGDPSCF